MKEPISNFALTDVYKNNIIDISSSLDNSLGGLFSILSPDPENYPQEEIPFYRKRRKKRRYGRQM